MKIIISPSKTFTTERKITSPFQNVPLYEPQASLINQHLQTLTKETIGTMMKIKGQLLDTTYDNIMTYQQLPMQVAIVHYTGFVFKKLAIESYKKNQWDYMHNHLTILSAHYGPLNPFDLIRPYRLDLTMQIPHFPRLIDFWKDTVTNYFPIDELIINLASNEFSQLIDRPLLTIDFLEEKTGKYRNLATYSKQARGLLLNYLIMNQVTTIEQIKLFCLDNYSFNEHLSTSQRFVFTRLAK